MCIASNVEICILNGVSFCILRRAAAAAKGWEVELFSRYAISYGRQKKKSEK